MRFAMGLVLLAAIIFGLARAWWQFVRPRLPSAQKRKARSPHGTIVVPLADPDKRIDVARMVRPDRALVARRTFAVPKDELLDKSRNVAAGN